MGRVGLLAIVAWGCRFEPGFLPADAGAIAIDGPLTADADEMPGVIARWELDETSGLEVRDSEPQPLDLVIEQSSAVTWSGGALAVEQPVQIYASAPASKIVTRVNTTRAFSVEAWVRPASTTANSGPARVFTVSMNGQSNSFTLGQEMQRWIFRVRRVSSDIVGRPELQSPNLAQAGVLSHLVASYDHGTRVMHVDGVEIARDQVDDDLMLNTSHLPAIASEPGIDQFGFRPWLGELHRIVIHDRALDGAEAAARFAAGP